MCIKFYAWLKMNPKKVVLVFPRFKYPSGDFSIGLAYIGAYLREHIPSLKLSVLDTSFNSDWLYIHEFFEIKKPDIVGIFTDTLMFKDALGVAKAAKSFGANIILGGPHPTILPDSCFNNDFVDAVCIGEGELTMADYVAAFYGGKGLSGVNGIWFKKDGQLVKNPPRPAIEDVNTLPFPAYDLFNMEVYTNNFVQLDSYSPNLLGASVIVSRGCPYMCAYCQPTLKKIFGPKMRIRSPQKAVEEIKILSEKYNVQAIYFQDDTLTAFKEWIKEFCELMVKERNSGLDIVWACNTRADTIDFETLAMMKDAGLVKLKVGIESITDRIRNGIYKKNVSREQINRLMADCKKLGIQLTGFFMLGAPTETEKEVKDTIRFAASSSFIEANFSIATPLPETFLYDFVKENNWNLPDDFGKYDYYKTTRPKMALDEINPEKLEKLKKLAYLYFYLHPKRILATAKATFGVKGVKKALLKLKRF